MSKFEDFQEFCFCRDCGKRTFIESDMGTHFIVDNRDGRWVGEQYHYTKDGDTIFYNCNLCGDAKLCHPRAWTRWPESGNYAFGPFTCGECDGKFYAEEDLNDPKFEL